MRVLVVHNRYSSRVPSGENVAVREEAHWLSDAGVDVHLHEVSNDDVVDASAVQRLGQAASAPWSLPAQRTLSRVIDRVRPDVVHVHNVFPLLSASVPAIAVRRGIPVAWTVHNHRVTCVIGTNRRDGRACHDCRPLQRVAGVVHGCYGGSRAASAFVTAATGIFAGIARRRLTAIAISEHVRTWLCEEGRFDPDRVQVKYNVVSPPAPGQVQVPPPAAQRTFLFLGYLIDHKGVGLLLDAWKLLPDLDARLRFVGDGPLAGEVQEAASADPRISWQPQVPIDEVPGHIADARAVVVPSTWEEPFGRGAAEAAALGRPVITSGTGGLSEVVTGSSGWLTGTDPHAMADAIAEASGSDAAVNERGAAGRRRYEQLFSPDATTGALIGIYDSMLQQSSSPRLRAPR